MKNIEINGITEQIFDRSDTFLVPPVGSTVTYRGPAFGNEGSRDCFATIECVIQSIHAPHDVLAPTVRLHSPEYGDAGCDVSCERLAETRRNESALRRLDEQLCAKWLAAERAGHKDAAGESFEPTLAQIMAKPGIDRERIERLAAGVVLSEKFVPYLPGTNNCQEAAMRAEGLLH